MSRVRRTRFVPLFRVRNDNPFISADDEPRYYWKDNVDIDVFDDADIRELDHSSRYPGKTFQLCVPMVDPETGVMTDADGDRSLLRILMVGAEIDLVTYGLYRVRGFVSQEELHHEALYRRQELEHEDVTDLMAKYVMEEWVLVYDE